MLGCVQVGNVPCKEEVLCDNELGTVPSSVVEPSGYKYDDPEEDDMSGSGGQSAGICT